MLLVYFVELTEPVEHDGLKLSAGRRRCPREADAPDAVTEHVSQDAGVRVTRRKVCVEPWVLPVSDLETENKNK